MLNILCESGMGVISWIIVFVPFIFMSVIVTLLLYFFGLNPSTGKINQPKQEKPEDKKKDGNLLFSV